MKGYEFTIVQDVYTESLNDQGEPEIVLVKPNLKTKWYCRDLDMITGFEQVYNTKGNVKIHHTALLVQGEERIVKLPYNKVKELLKSSEQPKIGFKQNR